MVRLHLVGGPRPCSQVVVVVAVVVEEGVCGMGGEEEEEEETQLHGRLQDLKQVPWRPFASGQSSYQERTICPRGICCW